MSGPFSYSEEQIEVLRFDRDLVVSAGAGSGKTRALVGVYCRLLSDPSIARPRGTSLGPHDILCLTFTNRAAGEIRRRIRETLLAPDLDARLGVRRSSVEPALLESWIRELEGAPIFTFHAFCHWLVMRHPLEAGIDPGAALLSEDEADDLMRRSTYEHLRHALRRGDVAAERAVEFAGLGGAVSAIMEIVSRIRTAGWDSARVIETFEARLAACALEVDGLADQLRATVEGMLADLAKERPTAVRANRIVEVKAALEAWWTGRGRVEPILEACKGAPRVWTDPVKALAQAWRGAVVEVEQAQQLGCWPALAVSAREAYRAARQSRAVLDFDDLVLRARELLSRDDIRRHYRRHFRAILVDEHQDTDPVQHGILELLVGPALSGHPGEDDARWFIVGDSQQSIYGFRGADVVSFQRLVETARGWDGHRTLKKNYRSRSELLAFFNDFFPEVLKRGTALYEIDYMEQESERTPVGWASVEYLDPAGLPSKMATPELRRLEAEALAARLWAGCDPQHPARIEIIDDGKARVARPGDIVVLLRKLTASELYRQALQRVGFDVVVAGGGQFYQRQEVYDCLHALEAALHAEDPIPLVAYLRSPMVGLPDEAIWRALNGADGRSGTRIRAWLAREESRAELDAEHRSRLAEGLAVLDELASRADSEPPASTLAWLIDRTGYASVLEALPDRSQRRANVERLIAGADRASVQGGGLLGDWVAALRRRVETPPRQHDAAPPASEGQIRIMTIHQAKGLEFPIVAVADIGGNPGQDFPRIAFHEEFGVVSQLWDDVAEDWIDSRTYMLAREANDRAERAEEMRLLYVAATRAREHLVLSAAARTGSRDRRWLAVFEPWSQIADSKVGLTRLPLDEWLAAFRSSQGAERRIPPPAEPYRDPLPASPGQIDARAVATALSGASEWQAVIEVRSDAAAARRAMRNGVTGHGALERLPIPMPSGFDLPKWLEEAGVDREEIERVARFVEKARPELERARRVEREHPFRLHLPNGVVVVGTIDVLLRDPSGDWWVWDYKFGERQERTEALHEAQLSIYALAAAAALDLTTVRGKLWHVGESEAHDFLWTQDQLVEIEHRVADVAVGQHA